jgi:hypothetical protein
MIIDNLLEVFEIVALRCDLVGSDKLFGLVLLRNILAFGRIEGSQVCVGDPSAVGKKESISK